MRGVVTLQVGLGLAALFLAVYSTANQLMAPVERAQLVRAARAEADAAAQRIASQWKDRCEAIRDVAVTMADTPVIRTRGEAGKNSDDVQVLARALDGVVEMAGGQGQATLLNAEGVALSEREGAEFLVRSQAAQAALRGRPAIIVEANESEVRLVAAAPVIDDAVVGALVLGVPLKSGNQRALLQGIPPGVAIAVQLEQQPVFGTLNAAASKQLATSSLDDTVAVEGREYRAHRTELAHDGTKPLYVLTLAALNSPGTASVAGHFQLLLLLMALGVAIVVALGALLSSFLEQPAAPAPGPTPDAKSADEDSPTRTSVPALTLNFGSPQTKPMGSKQSTSDLEIPEVSVPAHAQGPIDASFVSLSSPPEPPEVVEPNGLDAPAGLMPASAVSSAPKLLTDSGIEVVSEMPDLSGTDGIEAVPLPPTAAEWSTPDSPAYNQKTLPAHPAPEDEPADGSEVADRFDEQFAPASPFGGNFAPPEPGGNFKEPTPYDAIARAAFAAPPPEPDITDQRTDLPAPKGPIPPEIKAAQRAEAQRQAASQPPMPAAPPTGSAYDPDLPIPKDLPMPTQSPSQSRSLPPPARRSPSLVPGGTRPVPLPGSDPERDPWRNPSVPRMNAARAPDGAAPEGPVPFDEAHYRSVYKQFIESKTQLGESVENLSYDGFRNKLRNSEESLLDRHGCRAVRFQVLVKDRTVSLRPQLVR